MEIVNVYVININSQRKANKMSKNRNESNGSKNDDWATPEYILNWVRDKYGEFFDPCPLKHDKSKWNGLEVDWKAINYINPPYNNKDKIAFIKKAYEEYKKGNICIMLIPNSTDLPSFHDIILPNATVLFTRGRVKFKGWNTKGIYVEDKSGQSGSMIIIFDKNRPQTIGTFDIKEMQLKYVKNAKNGCKKEFVFILPNKRERWTICGLNNEFYCKECVKNAVSEKEKKQ